MRSFVFTIYDENGDFVKYEIVRAESLRDAKKITKEKYPEKDGYFVAY